MAGDQREVPASGPACDSDAIGIDVELRGGFGSEPFKSEFDIINDGGQFGLGAEVAVSTQVVFRRLSEAEIDAYVATGEPMDKAGAYGIQGSGALLAVGVRGDFNNVVGLPVTPLMLLLRGLGVEILGAAGEVGKDADSVE